MQECMRKDCAHFFCIGYGVRRLTIGRKTKEGHADMKVFASCILVAALSVGDTAMGDTSALTAAKRAKKDEFYTQRVDIENELRHYKAHFEGSNITRGLIQGGKRREKAEKAEKQGV